MATLPATEEETITLINELRMRTADEPYLAALFGVDKVDLSEPLYLQRLRSEDNYKREIELRYLILGES